MPPKEQKTAVQASGGYDQQLIAKAPEITKADRQVRSFWDLTHGPMCLLSPLDFRLLTYRFSLVSL